MADALDQIVQVTVTRETRAPSQRGFGTPLLVGYHTAWGDRVREYGDETEMLDDGFTTDDYLYQVAAVMKAQNPAPETFKIGRRASAFTQLIHLIPRNIEVGFEHSIAVDGVTYTYEVETGDAVADIVAGLAAGMTGAAGITAAGATTHVTCTAAPGVLHTYVAKAGLDLLDATADPGLLADLTAIHAEDPDWYGVLLDSNSAAEIAVLDGFVESNIALGVVQSADWNVKDAGETGDIATTLKTAAITRTGGIYHREIGTPIAAAWMAKELPKNPGLSTWAHKTLAIIPANTLSSGERSAINGKNWSWYTTVGGQNITFEGKTPAGEFLDIIHQIDFSTARVQESVFGTLTGNDRVPQTDQGIEVFRSAVLTALKLCASTDYPIFDPNTLVVRPMTMADVPTADRANRILRGLTYEARLQGAFHRVVVRGRVYL